MHVSGSLHHFVPPVEQTKQDNPALYVPLRSEPFWPIPLLILSLRSALLVLEAGLQCFRGHFGDQGVPATAVCCSGVSGIPRPSRC